MKADISLTNKLGQKSRYATPRKELFSRDVYERQQLNLQKVFESGEPRYVEELTHFREKTLWLGTWLLPLKDKEGRTNTVLGVSRDITERRRAEIELKKEINELLEAQGKSRKYGW